MKFFAWVHKMINCIDTGINETEKVVHKIFITSLKLIGLFTTALVLGKFIWSQITGIVI